MEFVLLCMNFDGGFGRVPGSESHAGQVRLVKLQSVPCLLSVHVLYRSIAVMWCVCTVQIC